METHSEQIHSERKWYYRSVGIGLLIFLFATGVVFSMEFYRSPQQQPVAQAASAAEALAIQNAFSSITLKAQSAIVMDLDDGTTLYTKNADAQLALASLTKVPLVLAVAEVLPTDSVITIQHDTSFNSKASQLLTGERWRTSDLISYTLVASSNDGAQILADYADESLRAKYPGATGKATIWRMNDLARELGLNSMYFINPTGLDESTTQSGAYGSARDVARLFAYATKSDPGLFEQTATPAISITSIEGRVAHAINTDAIIDRVPGMIMGKTGLTDIAGGNLAVVFAANGRRYAAVVLGSTEEGRFTDMQQLTTATRIIAVD